MKKIKRYFKRLWSALWSSTELDEKALAAIDEAKERVKMMKLELADVKKTLKNVANQSKDVLKQVPSVMQPLNDNLNVEYLRPLKDAEIAV